MSLYKLSTTKFVQKFMGPGQASKPILIKDQSDYGDLQDTGVVKFKDPSIGSAMSDVPFYYSKFQDRKIAYPELSEVIGQDKADNLLGNIQAHKDWIGKNDARISFVPIVGVNSSNPDTGLVTVNAISPAVVHHELGHLNSSIDSYPYRYIRNRANFIGPAISGLALAAKKLLGVKSPLADIAMYGGAAVPLLGQMETMRNENAASNNAREFIAGHYNPEEIEQSNTELDAGLRSHAKGYRKATGISLATLLGSMALNKKL